MIVTIGGYPGSGKGTVGRLVASKLGYEYYSMGDIWGETAKKHGMTLNEFHEHLRKNPAFDRELEAFQESLGKQDALVIDSRLGYYCIPHALKVFLTVDWHVGAQRIVNTHRPDEHYHDVAEAEKQLRARAENERIQYRAVYHTDHYELSNYDLVIDTTHKSPQEIADMIIARVTRDTSEA